MEAEKKTGRPNTWMIVGIILGVISVALGVILAITYANMPNRDEIAAEAYDEAKDEYKDELAKLRQYYEIRLKRNNTPSSDNEEKPDEADVEPEDDKYNELYSIYPVNATSTQKYIYIPAVNKKLKIDSSIKNVKYIAVEDGIYVWAIAKDAPKNDYEFLKQGPLITISINSKEYIDTYMRIEPDLADQIKKMKDEAIIFNNGNYLGIHYWFNSAYTIEDEEEDEWLVKSREAVLKIVKNKDNYEDIE